ncbi:DegT/DnrJ/EryC1/StrS aminotransferase family protein [Helicobacter sp. MIT 14-3879]|uniref:DegT/DnrJ/EryC1/StrS family aminotransferase n=1 Tax=Helicobacter sp. MIT 14-3879 TaxID=2040649 RepID=UPI001C69EF76|nr:DegT/DnrJ/EryC1/StrS family aminotransferase [Helicobacter sp. MIT 14-3879]
MQINITKPYLPDKNKYYKYIDRIWQNNHLTNFGPMSLELENRLCEYLDVPHILLVSNGTLALQIAYKILRLDIGDTIISTPFSFVATSNTIIWENLKVRFCDISKDSFCIDTNKLKNLLNTKDKTTKAILPVHVFGNACDVEELDKIAKENSLYLIYDAAHAFGVKYKDKSIFKYGDIATISFHSTKIFHTIEGGAIIFRDKNLFDEARSMINFGLKNNMPEILGINTKNSEFHAAMGLCILDDINLILEDRNRIWEYYYKNLKDYFEFQKLNSSNNYHYFPILFKNEQFLITKLRILNENNIFPRRYFYPSLDTLRYNTSEICPISRDIASRVLCLPLYVGLSQKEQDKIIKILIKG